MIFLIREENWVCFCSTMFLCFSRKPNKLTNSEGSYQQPSFSLVNFAASACPKSRQSSTVLKNSSLGNSLAERGRPVYTEVGIGELYGNSSLDPKNSGSLDASENGGSNRRMKPLCPCCMTVIEFLRTTVFETRERDAIRPGADGSRQLGFAAWFTVSTNALSSRASTSC